MKFIFIEELLNNLFHVLTLKIKNIINTFNIVGNIDIISILSL